MLQMALVVRKRGLADVLLPSSKHSFSVVSLLFWGTNRPHLVLVSSAHIHTSPACLWL